MSDDDNTLHLVHYAQNVEASSNTGVIAFHDEDRDDLAIGQVGYVTSSELYKLAAHGVLVTPITVEDANTQGLTAPELRGKYAKANVAAPSDTAAGAPPQTPADDSGSKPAASGKSAATGKASGSADATTGATSTS